ncbi:hypothetical protein I541_5729 [Mycobacteroides abscessus]|nr:hypothetical protein I541_5729 [Mycobacteroides abscessus]
MVRRFLRICHKTIGTADVGYVASDADGTQENEDVETSSHRRREEGMPALPYTEHRAAIRCTASLLSGPAGIPAADPRNARAAPKQCGRPASTTPPRHTPFTSPITPESDTTIGTSVRVAARQEFSGRDSGRKTRNTFVYKDFDALHMYNFCMTKGLIRLPDTPSRYVML